jgi:hypothetical protein
MRRAILKGYLKILALYLRDNNDRPLDRVVKNPKIPFIIAPWAEDSRGIGAEPFCGESVSVAPPASWGQRAAAKGSAGKVTSVIGSGESSNKRSGSRADLVRQAFAFR